MLRASFYKNFLQGLLICLIALTGTSCTQEYLILVRNLDRAQLITLDDVLHESGLEPRTRPVEKRPVAVNPDSGNYREADVNRPSTNILKRLTVFSDQDFSIQIPPETNFIILKSVQGGLKYLKNKSDLSNGLYNFHAGMGDGSIEFQTFNTNGRIDRAIVYFVRVDQRQTVTAEPVVTNKKNQTNEQTNANAPSPDLSQMILSSIQGLSPTEASRELLKMLSTQEITDNDKEFIRYQLVDIMIAQRNYAPAEEQIGLIRSDPMKTLYRARFLRAKGNQKEAVRNYIGLLSGGEDTKKKAILELEDLVLDMGSVDKSLVESLKSETAKFKSDKDFYGTSMVRIAKIYPYLQDVYTARDILEKIIAGNYNDEIEADANKALDSLKKDFLEYR